jgi:hypothetical protein
MSYKRERGWLRADEDCFELSVLLEFAEAITGMILAKHKVRLFSSLFTTGESSFLSSWTNSMIIRFEFFFVAKITFCILLARVGGVVTS